jgi:hypothetical protein
MNTLTNNRFNVVMLAVAVLITAIAVATGAMSARALENDGRLNLVHHMGGDTVYCVGENLTPSDSYANGGLRLLNQAGQQLFFVPASVINAVSEMPLVDTRIAAGPGSHGAVELWRLTNGDFKLVGMDEHGKQFMFQWTGCTQVGTEAEPVVVESAPVIEEEPECEEPYYNLNEEVVALATPEVNECYDYVDEYPR